MNLKDADGVANYVDPDQTDSWAIWYGSALFVHIYYPNIYSRTSMAWTLLAR